MNYWFDTVETIPQGVGFDHYSPVHLLWLAVFAGFALASCLLYRHLGKLGRKRMRRCFACAIVADELFKMVVLFLGGRYLPDYLPLHLCSINIFVICYHNWRPSKMVDNFLYTICIPGALAALLFPSWASLPAANCMHIHSFTVHILLATYPLMMVCGGDIKPELRYLPKCLALLAGLALVALGFNLVFDTNFMFLMYAEPGNPLYLFQEAFGSHLVGFPVLIAAVLVVMYAPWLIAEKCKARKK